MNSLIKYLFTFLCLTFLVSSFKPLVFLRANDAGINISNEELMKNIISTFKDIDNIKTNLKSIESVMQNHDKRLSKDDIADIDRSKYKTNLELSKKLHQIDYLFLIYKSRASISKVPKGIDNTYIRAEQYLANGDVKKAELTFLDFLKNNPSGKYANYANYWLGNIYFYLSEYPKSLNFFAQAYKNASQSIDQAYSLYGVLTAFNALQSKKDVCTILFSINNEKFLSYLSEYEINNIRDISKDNSCFINLKTITSYPSKESLASSIYYLGDLMRKYKASNSKNFSYNN